MSNAHLTFHDLPYFRRHRFSWSVLSPIFEGSTEQALLFGNALVGL